MTAFVLDDMRSNARREAVAAVRNCPLSPAQAQAWIDLCVARVTQAHADAAMAWAQRFVFEYQDIVTELQQAEDHEPMQGRLIQASRDRLAWWKRVAALGRSVPGNYDSVGTRDRLRRLMAGDYDDEIDACLGLYWDEGHARCVVSALAEVMTTRKVA